METATIKPFPIKVGFYSLKYPDTEKDSLKYSDTEIKQLKFLNSWDGTLTSTALEIINEISESERSALRLSLASTPHVLPKDIITKLLDDNQPIILSGLLAREKQIDISMLEYAYLRAKATLDTVISEKEVQIGEVCSVIRWVINSPHITPELLVRITDDTLARKPKVPYSPIYDPIFVVASNTKTPLDLLIWFSEKYKLRESLPEFHMLQAIRMHNSLIRNQVWLDYLCTQNDYPKGIPTDWIIKLFYENWIEYFSIKDI
jgi:hypothetical protein